MSKTRMALLLAVSALLSPGCPEPAAGGPTLSGLADVVVKEGEVIALEPEAAAPDGGEVYLSYEGYLTGPTAVAGAPGEYSATVTARDASGRTTSREVRISVRPDDNPNRAAFDPAAAAPWSVPFPSNQFTVADGDMATGRRVNLPSPAALDAWEEADFAEINRLDGFSNLPRAVLPFTGSAPDASGFTSDNVFFVALEGPTRGDVMPVNQRAVDGSGPSWVFAPDLYLRESTRYALVAIRALAVAGAPVSRSTAMNEFLHAYTTGAAFPAGSYEAEVAGALDTLISTRAVRKPEDLLTISVFSVRTSTDLLVKLRDRLENGGYAVEALDFDCSADHAGAEIFPLSAVVRVDLYVHRASAVADGVNKPAFPPHPLLILTSNELYVMNGSKPANGRVRVHAWDIKIFTGAVTLSWTNVTSLTLQAGNQAVLLERKKALSDGTTPRPWRFDQAVGHVAFGTFRAPRYTDAAGRMAAVKTRPGFVPEQTGAETIVFAAVTPAGAPPGGAWPLAHFCHGALMSGYDAGFFTAAASMAELGIATVGFSAPGMGDGPMTSLEVTTASGVVRIAGAGRTADLDGDGIPTDGANQVQNVADHLALVRAIQAHGASIGGIPLSTAPGDTFAFGASMGAATTFMMSAVDPRVGWFAPNVIGFDAGNFPRMGPFRGLVHAPMLEERGLLNGASPLWGGTFDEDAPLQGLPVQASIKPSAIPIQRAFDFDVWKGLQGLNSPYVHPAMTGALRGSPPPLLFQIATGDGLCPNPQDRIGIVSGEFAGRTVVVRLHRAGGYGGLFGNVNRHCFLGFDYDGSSPSAGDSANANAISHAARVQIAEFFANRGGTVRDPDPNGDVYFEAQGSGGAHLDVFGVFAGDADLEEMMKDPHLE